MSTSRFLYFSVFLVSQIIILSISQALADSSLLANSNNRFASDIYKKMESGVDNLFFSPYSIGTALQLAGNGAKDNTRKQILSALHIDDTNNFLANALHLNEKLANTDVVTFTIANSLWAEQSYGIVESYINESEKYFKSEVRKVDFKGNPDNERLAINSWVSDKTKNKINDLLAPRTITRDTRVVLANAVYFLGKWAHQFNPEATHPSNFYINPEEKVQAQFMAQTRSFNFYEDDKVQVVQLPYEGGSFVMEIFLPKANLKDIESIMYENKALKWIAELKPVNVSVQIPRFKSESSFSLVDVLIKLGITDAFKFGVADFSGISNNKELVISDVIHKAFVEVGEKGTEAAAATAVIMEARGALIKTEKPKVFRADRPFIYQIRHIPTDSKLFLGRLNRP